MGISGDNIVRFCFQDRKKGKPLIVNKCGSLLSTALFHLLKPVWIYWKLGGELFNHGPRANPTGTDAENAPASRKRGPL